MYCVDTSNNIRLPRIMQMVGSISRAQTPQEAYKRIRAGMNSLDAHAGYLALSTRNLKPGQYKITRFELHGKPQSETDDPWNNSDAMTIHTGGFIGELIKSAWPEIIHHLQLTDDPVLGNRLADFGSMMIIPLFDAGEPLNWSILLDEDPEHYTQEDLEEVIVRANFLGGMTKSLLMRQQLAEAHEKIHTQVEQIATIQRSLLPDPLPEIDGVELAASYETSEQAGGDYYDFFEFDSNKNDLATSSAWGILIADVSGHGPSAAVIMAMLHSILHAFPRRERGPAAVLEHANVQLCAKRLDSSFVTALFAVYDPATRKLTYARAGHNPPILKNGSKVRRLEKVGGYPLGIDPTLTLEENTITLEPGETIIFYTDGITEAMNHERTMFGTAGIERALADCTGKAQCTVDSIMTALRDFEASPEPLDDQTLVAMQVVG